jgi:hypothetical protein
LIALFVLVVLMLFVGCWCLWECGVQHEWQSARHSKMAVGTETHASDVRQIELKHVRSMGQKIAKINFRGVPLGHLSALHGPFERWEARLQWTISWGTPTSPGTPRTKCTGPYRPPILPHDCREKLFPTKQKK